MIIAVEDKSYRCKNCDSFSQCKYYHHRRPDSHICKEFRNDWKQKYKVAEILDKISAEIKDTCTWDDKTLTPTIGAEKVLEIIEKYKGVSK